MLPLVEGLNFPTLISHPGQFAQSTSEPFVVQTTVGAAAGPSASKQSLRFSALKSECFFIN